MASDVWVLRLARNANRPVATVIIGVNTFGRAEPYTDVPLRKDQSQAEPVPVAEAPTAAAVLFTPSLASRKSGAVKPGSLVSSWTCSAMTGNRNQRQGRGLDDPYQRGRRCCSARGQPAGELATCDLHPARSRAAVQTVPRPSYTVRRDVTKPWRMVSPGNAVPTHPSGGMPARATWSCLAPPPAEPEQYRRAGSPRWAWREWQ